MRFENVLQTIGRTPLIKLNNVCADIPAQVYAKVESFNPGQSAKDRIALYMIEQAEKAGKLKPGSTIIEATSGNTGFGLAMVCSVKGYNCLLCVSSKASKEKLALLRSMGAEVVICPSNAKPEDPESYYSRAAQFAKDIPNSFYIAQNFNPDNAGAHYYSTGPEIWDQTEGKITHYVCCVGTGGTMSGTARYLKEQNPDVQIVGVDAYGSV
ncbi:MAG: cysteine synthase family protein, partial [Bacteroidota bacterium]